MALYRYNAPGAKVSEGARESFLLPSMLAGLPAAYFCVKAFSETDLTEDLRKIDAPRLILHGDDDQIGADPSVSARRREAWCATPSSRCIPVRRTECEQRRPAFISEREASQKTHG